MNSIIFLQSTVHWGCLFQEMRENLPGFSFRLVEINIDKTELQRVRKETILDLLNPLNTVLDDSIGKFMFIKGLSGKLKVSGKNVWIIRVFDDRKTTISFSSLLGLKFKCYLVNQAWYLWIKDHFEISRQSL